MFEIIRGNKSLAFWNFDWTKNICMGKSINLFDLINGNQKHFDALKCIFECVSITRIFHFVCTSWSFTYNNLSFITIPVKINYHIQLALGMENCNITANKREERSWFSLKGNKIKQERSF